jgi:hypothetical protein
MAYYLLTVQRPGSWSYKEVANARHHVEASSLDEAKWHADALIDDHYPAVDKAIMQLFDETGLVATRRGDGDWSP